MTVGRIIAIILGVIATVYLCWFILSENVVEIMMEDVDTGGESTPLSSPLAALGTAAFLFYPAFYTRLYWLRTNLRLAARLAVVFYFMIALLVIIGVLGSLGVVAKAHEPDITAMVAILVSAVMLVVGALAIRSGKAKSSDLPAI